MSQVGSPGSAEHGTSVKDTGPVEPLASLAVYVVPPAPVSLMTAPSPTTPAATTSNDVLTLSGPDVAVSVCCGETCTFGNVTGTVTWVSALTSGAV